MLTGTISTDIFKKVTRVVDVTCQGRSYPLLRYVMLKPSTWTWFGNGVGAGEARKFHQLIKGELELCEEFGINVRRLLLTCANKSCKKAPWKPHKPARNSSLFIYFQLQVDQEHHKMLSRQTA
jgi:hypothetical protein